MCPFKIPLALIGVLASHLHGVAHPPLPNFVGAIVNKVTFKQLNQRLRTHTQFQSPLRTFEEETTYCPLNKRKVIC
jgi:hypothetical protein